MLGNHLVSELLCWKVEFFLSLTAWWYIGTKHTRSYFGDDLMAYQSHGGQQQNIRFGMKQKSRHTGLHALQTHKKRARSHAGLPQLQSEYSTWHIICKKKVIVWKKIDLRKERKAGRWRGRYVSSSRSEGSKSLFTALPLAHSNTAELFRFPMPWLTRQYNGYNTSSCP